MVNGQAGKGSRYRPVDQKKYDEGWAAAFEKKKKKKTKEIKPKKGEQPPKDL